MIDRWKIAITAALLLCVFAGRLGAQKPVPAVVSATSTGGQFQPAAGTDTLNRTLVVWRDSAGAGEAILVQGFDTWGGRTGPTVAASAVVTGGVSAPSLGASFRGSRPVVAWSEKAGAVYRVLFRRFLADGSAVELALPRSSLRIILGRNPAAAADSSGNIYLVWQDGRGGGQGQDIYGNWISARDTLGASNIDSTLHGWVEDKKINLGGLGDQTDPALAVDRYGRVLVAWRDTLADSVGIYVRAFGEKGVEIQQTRLPSGDPRSIAALTGPVVATGGFDQYEPPFVVSWIETDTLGVKKLYLRKVVMDPFANPPSLIVDSAFAGMVRSRSGLAAGKPSVSGDEEGWVALGWTEDDGSGAQIYGMSFYLGDGTLPPNMRLTEPLDGFGTPAGRCAIAVRSEGEFSLVWEDRSGTDTDLRLQNYGADGTVLNPFYMSPAPDQTATGNVVFRGLAEGRFLMYLEAGSGFSARIRVVEYDRHGKPIAGPPVDVAPGARTQTRPITAGKPGLWSLVAWEERGGSSYSLNGMIYSPAGEVKSQGLSFETSGQNHLGALAGSVDSRGRFYLAWERWQPDKNAPDLMLGVFDSLGNRIGSAGTVVSYTVGGGRLAAVAATADGSQIVVWRQGAAGEKNAYVAGRIYRPDRTVARDGIRVSEQKLQYLGTAGRPAAAASDSSGNFLVVWQEFFNQTSRIYCRMFTPAGDSLDLGGGYRRELVGDEANSGTTVRHNPAVTTDSAGGFLVLWVETQPGASDELYGRRLDRNGLSLGSTFRVPGIDMASLPAVHIIGPERVVVAWQDTTGENTRVLAVQLDFHEVLGQVAAASTLEAGIPLLVHIQGNVNDSTAVAPDGSFRFINLTAGSYTLYLTAEGRRIEAGIGSFTVPAGAGPQFNLGVVARLDETTLPELPRAGTVFLHQNVPNPFNPSTTVAFDLPGNDGSVQVVLAVYDLRGRLVRTLLSRELESGTYSVQWNGEDQSGRRVASGVYFLRLTAGDVSRLRKLVLLK